MFNDTFVDVDVSVLGWVDISYVSGLSHEQN